MNLQQQLHAASGIAQEAGNIVLSYFRTENVDTQLKGTRDVVTAADKAAEKFLVRQLQETFVADGVTAEEGSSVDSRNGRRWFIDPLDGTLNFSRGLPLWCVSIALFEASVPVLGVIVDPVGGDVFTAASGHGAYCNGSVLHPSESTRLEEAFVQMSVDFHDNSMLLGLEDLLLLAPRVLRTRNLGSAALGLAYVASGYLDAMLHRFAHTWDYGAGALLVQEAGGIVTDYLGNRYTDSTQSVIASANASLQSDLLDAFRGTAPSSLQ